MRKTAFITGGSGSIGQAAAVLLAQKGFAVAVQYHTNREAAEALCRALSEAGREAVAVRADLTDAAQAERAVAAARTLGPVSVLVNSAGIADRRLFCDISETDWKRMLDVHVNAAFYCTKAVLPDMIRRKKGAIVNVSSMWGLAGASCEVHYATAKAALIGMTRALAREVGPSGVRVNCVAPGVIDTPMIGDLSEADKNALISETPLGRLGTAEDAARSILFLATDESAFVTGQVISPNGGFVI